MATKQWFRPFPIGQKTLLEETRNAKRLNSELAKKIKEISLTNVIFIDPLEILDRSCGRDIKSYLECFRDSDHMSDKSAKELLLFIMKNHYYQI